MNYETGQRGGVRVVDLKSIRSERSEHLMAEFNHLCLRDTRSAFRERHRVWYFIRNPERASELMKAIEDDYFCVE